jgi:hypothetical protein
MSKAAGNGATIDKTIAEGSVSSAKLIWSCKVDNLLSVSSRTFRRRRLDTANDLIKTLSVVAERLGADVLSVSGGPCFNRRP